jgi:hypothetical protein
MPVSATKGVTSALNHVTEGLASTGLSSSEKARVLRVYAFTAIINTLLI